MQLRALKRRLADDEERGSRPGAARRLSSSDAALPLDDAGPYVAAAYLVFLALLLIYVAIMAGKLVRIARELGELTELVERRERSRDEDAEQETVPR